MYILNTVIYNATGRKIIKCKDKEEAIREITKIKMLQDIGESAFVEGIFVGDEIKLGYDQTYLDELKEEYRKNMEIQEKENREDELRYKKQQLVALKKELGEAT